MFNQRRGFRLVATALSLGGLVACNSSNQGKSIDFNAHDFEGFESTQVALIVAACSIDGSGNMTLTVGAGETAYVFKRVTDGRVVANALTANGVECTVLSTKRVIINSHNPAADDTQKVIIDYYGGSFSTATAVSTFPATNNANIQINLGAGASDQVKIRGSQWADNLTLGTTGTVSYASIAVGTTLTLPAARTFHDVSMIGVEDVVVSMGPGNDNISALGIGGSATAASTPNALAGDLTFTAYGGDGNDILTSGALSTTGSNSLYGNEGNDKFVQQVALAKDFIDGGGHTTGDVVDYSSRANPVAVTLDYGTAAVAATATLKTPAKTNLLDNQTFTLSDGTNTVTFEYEVTGGFVAAGAPVEVIDVSDVTVTTAAQVAYATAVAINAVGAGLLITAALPAVATITLTQDTAGVAGNTAATETVVDDGFVLSNPFAGGAAEVEDGANDGETGELDEILGTVENVVGGAGADTLDASNVGGVAHILVGGAGDDTLIGAALADTLFGGQGNDTLIGGASADTLRGGDGDDVLQGGAGDDIIDGGGANCPTTGDVIATCTAATPLNIGINLLDFSDRIAAVSCDLSTPSGALVVCGEVGEHDLWVASSIRNLRGGKGNDTLQGDGLANSIWGGEGNDAINGMGGDDTLYGEAGNDTIHGGTVDDDPNSGNDFISGGTGADSLYGADGNDLLDSDDGMVDLVINCGNQDADIGVSDVKDPAKIGCSL